MSAQPAPAASLGANAAKLDLFQFVSKGKIERRMRVLRFRGEEHVNEAYEFDLELLTPHDIDPLGTLEDELLGHPGSLLMMEEGNVPRPVHGLVTGYEVLGSVDRTQSRVRLTFEPRLSLLRLRTQSRIYQDKSVPEIVGALFREWRVRHTFELVGTYAPRTYCTQYKESDYDFIRRILAREGIFFFFRQPSEGETEEVVMIDDALYRGIPGRAEARLAMRSGRFEIGEGDVTELGVRRRIRPTAARTADHDFRHPRLPLRELKLAQDPRGALAELGTERYNTYLHGHEAEHEFSQSAKQRAIDTSRTLDSLRSDGLLVLGTSRSRRLLPGHSFLLEGHSLEGLNREWAIAGVVHEGKSPEFGAERDDDVYRNEFEAAPMDTALRMPLDVRKRLSESAHTATVVGAGEGEVFTDAQGRVKVQFHWDLEGKNDEHSSCWIRVAQTWAGAGFGSQFLPRVGSEVLVSFLDGDPDRPIVVGSIYNGTNPFPFGLPGSNTRSGFRTTSTPGGGGANELSFEDKKGEEQILLRAQRNFEAEVGKDHVLKVAGSSDVKIDGHVTETITGTQTTTVVGGQTTLVTLHDTKQVTGNVMHAVTGNSDRRVSGDDVVRVEGTSRQDLAASEVLVSSDAVLRVRGHLATIVGADNARMSATLHVQGQAATYTTGPTEVIAETGIVLRCGESSIRLGPDRIEIHAPTITMTGDALEGGFDRAVTLLAKENMLIKAERVNINGKSSGLLLFKDADLGGDKVKLNCTIEEDAVIARKVPLTTIQLLDESGVPAANRRYVIVGPTGERSGVLDDRGEAELELEQSAQIYFPDVDRPRKA